MLTCLTTSCLSFTVHHQGRPFSRLSASEVQPDSELPDYPSLGILRLDYHCDPIVGDIDHEHSFGYPVHYKKVEGLSFEMCKEGEELTGSVQKEFDDAVDYLVKKGVKAITGDCGFMQNYQKYARNRTDKPVFISSLMQLPAMTAAFSKHETIMVVTANKESLEPLRQELKKECGIDHEDKRFIFVGCEHVQDFGKEVEEGWTVDPDLAGPNIVKLVVDTLALPKCESVKAILMECTELPHYSDAVRNATQLPVFDAITNCDMVMSSFLDKGEDKFYQPWNRDKIDKNDNARYNQTTGALIS
jgi:Asp/Glu/hydantoin racemase